MIYEFKSRDAYDFANRQHIQAKPKGSELHFQICPYCQGGQHRDKGSFSINLDTGMYKCLRSSCNAQGNFTTLARDFNFSLGIDFDRYYSDKSSFKKFKVKKVETKDEAVKYMQSRGISEATTRKYEITVHNKHNNILVFPFFDENSNLKFIKYRKTDFNRETDRNKEWCEENCMPILFGMKQCNDKFGRLVITEGQIDSLSVAEAGIENAVSVPMGAKGFTWVPYVWDWFSKFEELIVFGDYENGKITLLDELKKRFPGKIMSVQPEDYKGCKDANELLKKYGRDCVRRAVENAKVLPIKRVKKLSEVEKIDIYSLPKLKTGIKVLDRILGGGLYYGQVDIISGKRGDGKSTLASQIIASALDQNQKVFAYSGELPEFLFKAWLDMQIAGPRNIITNTRVDGSNSYIVTNSTADKISHWYDENMYIYDNSIVVDDEEEDLIKTIKETIMQYGVRVILIDNLMTAIDLDVDPKSSRYETQGDFVKKLTKIALRFDVLILLVAHSRKNNFTTDVNDEVSGSADITNLAGVVLGYNRGKDKDGKPFPQSQRLLIVSKSRLIGKLNFEGFILDYNESSKRITGDGDDVNKAYGWEKLQDGFISINNDNQTPFGSEDD